MGVPSSQPYPLDLLQAPEQGAAPELYIDTDFPAAGFLVMPAAAIIAPGVCGVGSVRRPPIY
jgi:hypothetical protein